MKATIYRTVTTPRVNGSVDMFCTYKWHAVIDLPFIPIVGMVLALNPNRQQAPCEELTVRGVTWYEEDGELDVRAEDVVIGSDRAVYNTFTRECEYMESEGWVRA